MALSGTIKDSQGNTWQWVNQGDRYGLQLIRGTENPGNVIGPAATVRWRGNRWYPSSLQVHPNGDVITAMSPGGDWG